jgi:predicted transcriptional regulator
MRTTIDIPQDLHATLARLAQDRRQSMSRTVSDLIRAGLQGRHADDPLEIDPKTGLALLRFGRPITSEDVAAALDDE